MVLPEGGSVWESSQPRKVTLKKSTLQEIVTDFFFGFGAECVGEKRFPVFSFN